MIDGVLLLAPAGFVAGHAEFLYDIDVAAQETGARPSLELAQNASLNTSPTFIQALVE